ncbi:MAG: hypothetical protein GTO45_14160 [Candidatus Aminicenantes bacterium]|nr:hypothetical protein [Candidatus Aminicenantes bacterium]NIM79910.1 hypothetical protein [Candidatus Aminicenantes bacterium]NIN19249.1 hypothetical protein [Candidatus Aminicenantes bacterium]NIN43152.1 hypothetical protein [Candidatus Aminicenantes bacterium]NIN85891.1 hypothetical protein [Candidatus Aminicenantes bacterium]
MADLKIKLNVSPEKRKYIVILALILVTCWLLYDFVLVKDEIFYRIDEYSFKNKQETEIKEKIKQEVKAFQSAKEPIKQIRALIHILECNYYLLYNRARRMERYYDFVKFVLHPSQRRQLKDKQSYVNEAKRHLKRKRNLPINFRKYEISRPVFSGPPGSEAAEVLVIRTLTEANGEDQGKEFFTYYFQKYKDNRFYLYFKKENHLLKLRHRFREVLDVKPGSPVSNAPKAQKQK